MNELIGEPELLDTLELAALFHLKPSTIRAWRLKRKLPFIKLGGRVFVRRADALALIEASVVPAKQTPAKERAEPAATPKADSVKSDRPTMAIFFAGQTLSSPRPAARREPPNRLNTEAERPPTTVEPGMTK